MQTTVKVSPGKVHPSGPTRNRRCVVAQLAGRGPSLMCACAKITAAENFLVGIFIYKDDCAW